MVKIARTQHAITDVQVACEYVQLFRPEMSVGRIAHAGTQFSHQHGISALRFQGEQFDPRAADRKLFPALRITGTVKEESGSFAAGGSAHGGSGSLVGRG